MDVVLAGIAEGGAHRRRPVHDRGRTARLPQDKRRRCQLRCVCVSRRGGGRGGAGEGRACQARVALRADIGGRCDRGAVVCRRWRGRRSSREGRRSGDREGPADGGVSRRAEACQRIRRRELNPSCATPLLPPVRSGAPADCASDQVADRLAVELLRQVLVPCLQFAQEIGVERGKGGVAPVGH